MLITIWSNSWLPLYSSELLGSASFVCVSAHQVSYKPFHNQLRKESLALFMKALVERAIALRIDHQLNSASLGAFKPVLLHDGTSFAGRFKAISPAAIECHMTMSLS